MATEVASAYVSIGASTKGLGSTIAKDLGKVKVEEPGKKVGARFGAAIGVGLAAASVVIAKGLSSAVNAASTLEESVNAVTVTYGDSADEILRLSENSANAVGLSSADFNALSVRFSGFAKEIAGAGGDVAGTFDEMSTRAADFASVQNLEVADAAGAFQSALAGEMEPMKQFGISMSAAAVDAYAMANGIGDGTGALTEAEKVQARYGLLMEETANTQGDFANTSGSLANVQRRLDANVTGLSATIGAALLPVMEKLSLVAVEVISYLADNKPVLVGLAAVAGTLLVGAIGAWTVSMVQANVVLYKNISAVAASTIAKSKDLAAGVALRAMYAVDMVRALAASAAQWVASTAAMIASRVATVAMSAATKAAAAAQWLMNAALTANPIGLVIAAVAALVAGLVWFFTKTEIGQKVWESFSAAMVKGWEWIKGAFAKGYRAVADFMGRAWDVIKQVWSYSPIGMITENWGAIMDFLKSVPGKVSDVFRKVGDYITRPFKNAFNGIASMWNNSVGRLSFTVPDIIGVPNRGETFSFPKLPYLAAGGTALGSGWSMVGEQGPELLHLQRGASVVPLARAGEFGGGPVTARIAREDIRTLGDYIIRNASITTAQGIERLGQDVGFYGRMGVA